MMLVYVINTDDGLNPGHNHEVHRPGCPYYPKKSSRVSLGEQRDAQQAVDIATYFYPDADGCKTCCPEAHHE